MYSTPRRICLALSITKGLTANQNFYKVRIENLIGRHTSGKVTNAPGGDTVFVARKDRDCES
jgi:hypothetical protein